MVGLARVLVHAFFRRVQVEHAERLEGGRPTVIVVNHGNGLVDGVLLIAALGRYPRFLGKSTLFHLPFLWPFLKLGGVVPVYRAHDGVPTSRNAGTFAVAQQLLAHGGMVAIFPEGISHDQPSLQALRTGAARIALGAADDGVVDLETVAVGLVYDDKQRFRSRALVRVGVPEPVAGWMGDYADDDHRAVRHLTAHLAERLRAVAPDYASWADAERVAGMAEIVTRAETVLPGEVGLADRQRVAVALTEAGDHPGPAVDRLGAAYDTYRGDLTMIGLNDAQVAASYGSGRLRWALVGAMAKVLGALPLAVAGMAIHLVPYQLIKVVGRIPANQGMRATVKLLGCLFTFTAVYVVLGVSIGEAFGAFFGTLAAVGAPVCGYLAIRMNERLRRMGGAIEGFRWAGHQGPVLASVLRHRGAVVDAAHQVLASTGAGHGAGGHTATDRPGP
jgi:glycerol-3-phosphate O-acyltransferase / dihydroxyacetone phosphate acyltransferase